MTNTSSEKQKKEYYIAKGIKYPVQSYYVRNEILPNTRENMKQIS